jgi:hypothetical protein
MNHQSNEPTVPQRAHRLAHVETTRATLAAIDFVALTPHERYPSGLSRLPLR